MLRTRERIKKEEKEEDDFSVWNNEAAKGDFKAKNQILIVTAMEIMSRNQ